MNIILEALKTSIEITGLVMIMMLLIEYINVKSHGKSFSKLQKSKTRQVLFATLLGLIPGCVGGFAVVSLFTHRLLSFGSLIAMMIASAGDEAFIMLAMIPKESLILFAILTAIAIVAGIIADKLFVVPAPFTKEHYEIHTMDVGSQHITQKTGIKENLKNIGKERALIIAGIVIFIIASLTGLVGHEHHAGEEHMHTSLNLLDEKWINILFMGVSILTLYHTLAANDHFIKAHLWSHVVLKHFRAIFLWTFGALIVIHYGMEFLHVENWIKDNVMVMILIAVLIGIIPESGPHIVFITLFASGVVPFSVLLASSIVQDGHTALPLLAESKKCFIKAKAFNMGVGLITGTAVHLLGF